MNKMHNFNCRNEDGIFFLYDGDDKVLTPQGIFVSTHSESLARRLVEDAAEYDADFTDLRSVLCFHGGTCNVLETMSEEESHEGVIEFCEDIIYDDPYLMLFQDTPIRVAVEKMYLENLPKTIDSLPIWRRMIFISYAMNAYLQTIVLPHLILSELLNAEGDPDTRKAEFLDDLKEFLAGEGEPTGEEYIKEYGEMIDALLYYFRLESI